MEESDRKPKDSETSVKETIESILIAFILAFVFRGFVVEAFVIPTGSMAPTLLGAHMRFSCDDCGYEWQVNYSGGGEGDEVFIPARSNKTYHIRCPNCGYRVQKRGLTDANNSAETPPVHYGDRILVLKYLYLLHEPKRWDVVVFKSPESPERHDYQQNYIKRLIGKPGEIVMILDGDVYVASDTGQEPRLEDFVVQTKPRHVQDALWRIVYDNDYLPQNQALGRNVANNTEPRWQQPWKRQESQTGWQELFGRTFHFDNPTGTADIYFDSTDRYPEQQFLTDWLAYDITQDQGPNSPVDTFNRNPYRADNHVSDVRLSFFYQRIDGDGPLRASIRKHHTTFIAEIATGKASLYRRDDNGPETLIGAVEMSGDVTRPTRIDLIHCDYQVTLCVDDQPVIKTTPDQYRPDLQRLLEAFNHQERLPKPAIRISASRQACTLSHISLWRDIYYINRVYQEGRRPGWATPFDFPQHLIRLKSDPPEYFCCGDNSPVSSDGRMWATPIDLPRERLYVESGRVPERFLLGKAFFVYWPAGYRPIGSAPAIIPNFGEMRFIH